jgi:hypothetical protein
MVQPHRGDYHYSPEKQCDRCSLFVATMRSHIPDQKPGSGRCRGLLPEALGAPMTPPTEAAPGTVVVASRCLLLPAECYNTHVENNFHRKRDTYTPVQLSHTLDSVSSLTASLRNCSERDGISPAGHRASKIERAMHPAAGARPLIPSV